ncbi:BtrH N-terminal domain-containing protein [Streptomyces rugosispiralis]|uniref:BtrH N-terminal domain-containing protein n=1 Tax=Streptomyces rugosispiralis TaxID=2967341 RepID=A0ABT1UTC6_9ACTN|nr:BtrH N-terminal domain-containing protein [Streptomyces rugosispiralis]MCQ8188271.1 BtrH N-terminal domain-containing protein [Streptomyces rugosispiralis]
MSLIDAQPFVGRHCESTTLVNLLRQCDIDLSEPLVFGLGSGLSFGYWHTKKMPTPFIGGRIRPDRLTANVTDSLGLRLTVRETSSPKRARERLVHELDSGTAVGLKLDRFHLDYSTDRYRFAAHYVACIGREDDRFALVETRPLGLQWTSGDALALARSARGPMSSRSLSFTINPPEGSLPDLGDVARQSIRTTAEDFLNPPISNFGFRGMRKAAGLMPGWMDNLESPEEALAEISTIMEDGGTGGGLFRAMWADFLAEAADLTGVPEFRDLSDAYRVVSRKWTDVAELLREAGTASSRGPVEHAAKLVRELAEEELHLMRQLMERSR